MQTYELKTDPIYFDKVWTGKKKSELRLNDRGFRQGDNVILNEFDRETRKFSGRKIRASISYVTDFPEALQNNFVMLCLNVTELSESFLD